jgi:hypothetical protein
MNRLAEESSPYLRQHAENPVDWYPWGAEALERARTEDKPVFLSIGYSACHWCHVMAHESFENPRVAEFLNAHFVCIKVDREERPDLDALYMRAIQILSGQGGWPLSAFLTPDLKPFYGGTYFPPEAGWGRPAFGQVLRGVLEAFRARRGEIETSSASVAEAVGRSFEPPDAPVPGDGAEAEARALEAILSRMDPDWGGFGGGPKFPQPPLLSFLLDASLKRGQSLPGDRVLFTLRQMEAGGVRDQVGGGFHRYSVDGRWRVPHYEKMLYDNAQLASLYFKAFRATGEEEFKRVAGEVLGDLERTFSEPGGGFIAALDADSEGEEGRYYLWTRDEVAAAIGPEEGRYVADLFGLGNGPGLEDRTLHRRISWDSASRWTGEAPEDFRRRILASLKALREIRESRRPPGADTKVLTDWNSLAAKAFLDGHAATGAPGLLARGLSVLDSVWDRAWDGERLFHVWDGDRAKVAGLLADHAYLAAAEWEAFALTGGRVHLKRVERLLSRIGATFRHPRTGRFYDAPLEGGDPFLLMPVRDAEDGVLPSALAVFARVLWSWFRLTGDAASLALLDSILDAERGALASHAGAVPLLAGLAADRASEPVEVVVSTPSLDEGARALLAAARGSSPPGALVVPLSAREFPHADAESFGLFAGRYPVSGARAFVCRGGTCRPPVQSPDEVIRLLSRGS